MHNAIVETIVAPICQVSPNYHLSPLLLLPSKNTSLLLSPLASPLHSYYFITQCTPYIYFYLPFSTVVFFPTMFSLLSFSHFLHYLWMSPCHQHISPYLPIIFQCYFHLPPTYGWRIPTSLPLPAPLAPYLFVYCIIYAYFPATRFFPHPSQLYDIGSLCYPPPEWPIWHLL